MDDVETRFASCEFAVARLPVKAGCDRFSAGVLAALATEDRAEGTATWESDPALFPAAVTLELGRQRRTAFWSALAEFVLREVAEGFDVWFPARHLTSEAEMERIELAGTSAPGNGRGRAPKFGCAEPFAFWVADRNGLTGVCSCALAPTGSNAKKLAPTSME